MPPGVRRRPLTEAERVHLTSLLEEHRKQTDEFIKRKRRTAFVLAACAWIAGGVVWAALWYSADDIDGKVLAVCAGGFAAGSIGLFAQGVLALRMAPSPKRDLAENSVLIRPLKVSATHKILWSTGEGVAVDVPGGSWLLPKVQLPGKGTELVRAPICGAMWWVGDTPTDPPVDLGERLTMPPRPAKTNRPVEKWPIGLDTAVAPLW